MEKLNIPSAVYHSDGYGSYITINSTSGEFDPLITPEEQKTIDDFFEKFPHMYKSNVPKVKEESKVNTHCWIQTFTSQRFNPINPDPATINIEDIAHALSNICRFTGHASVFYSVAEHSVLTSYVCDYKNRLTMLLHDGSEAYLSDIASPVKRSPDFEKYREIENTLQTAIYKKFGINDLDEEDIKRSDLMLLATEARDLMTPLRFDWVQPMKPLPFKIVPLPPQEAKRLFMQRFVELTT